MTNLSVFNFESYEVRFVGTPENPWWVASDVCTVLELDNVSRALQRLDVDEKRDDITISDAIGRSQSTWCVNESGLYSLILASRKPQAKRFKKWLTSEVIPSIRKTGSYSALPQSSLTPDFLQLQSEVDTIFQQIEDHEKAITQHQQAIKQLEQALTTTKLKLADVCIELYEPLRQSQEASHQLSSPNPQPASLSPEAKSLYTQHIQEFLRQHRRQSNADKKEDYLPEAAKLNINRIDPNHLKAYVEKHCNHKVTEGKFEQIKSVMSSLGYSYESQTGSYAFIKIR